MPSPALFAAAHPDDEVLAMGTAIAGHLAAGQDVHILWLTDGDASGVTDILNGTVVGSWWGVRHDPLAEGYAPLTPQDLAAARVAEAQTAAACLAAGTPGTLTLHRAGLPDTQVTAADAQAAVLAVADAIAPAAPVRLKGHSHVVDNNTDHLAIGQALRALAAADPPRFAGPRHYVLPAYWTDPRLSQVAEFWDAPAAGSPTALRVRNACRAYAAWAPRAGSYAIGYHSVASMFDQLTPAPKCMVHT